MRGRILAVIVAGLFFASVPDATASPGDLDAGFGDGGRATTDFTGGRDLATTVVVQPDGMIVVAGMTEAPFPSVYPPSDFALAQYNADGTPDATFGSAGRVITSFSPSPWRHAGVADVALQPDGKIVAGGTSCDGIPPGGSFVPLGSRSGVPATVDHTSRASTSLPDCSFAVARYLPNGSPDPTFGIGGRVTTDFLQCIGVDVAFSGVSAVVPQADGKFVAVGEVLCGDEDDAWRSHFALARYLPDGRLDATFGEQGLVTTRLRGTARAAGVVLEASGRLIVAGTDAVWSMGHPVAVDLALVAYRPDGELDSDFGDGGVVLTDLGEHEVSSAVVAQSSNRLVVAGSSEDTARSVRMLLVGYLPDGSIDPSFGTGGSVIREFGGYDAATDLVVQTDGKLVVSGGGGDFQLARFLANGQGDGAFGHAGVATADFGTPVDHAWGLAIAPDTKLVAAGYSSPNWNYNFAVARFHG